MQKGQRWLSPKTLEVHCWSECQTRRCGQKNSLWKVTVKLSWILRQTKYFQPIELVPVGVGQRVESVIHWMNHYPPDKSMHFDNIDNTYLLNGDLSSDLIALSLQGPGLQYLTWKSVGKEKPSVNDWALDLEFQGCPISFCDKLGFFNAMNRMRVFLLQSAGLRMVID